MIMSKVEIFGERNPILKFSSKSDERFSNLHYVKDIWGHTHTHTHTETKSERELVGQTERCGLHTRHSFVLLK